MDRLFGWLRSRSGLALLPTHSFATEAAHFLAELNAIHPFRDGNGRAQLTFLALLSVRAGHPLMLERLDPRAVLPAMIAAFKGDETPLTAIILDLIRAP